MYNDRKSQLGCLKSTGGIVAPKGTPDEIANNQEVKAVYLGHGDEINESVQAEAAHG